MHTYNSWWWVLYVVLVYMYMYMYSEMNNGIADLCILHVLPSFNVVMAIVRRMTNTIFKCQ